MHLGILKTRLFSGWCTKDGLGQTGLGQEERISRSRDRINRRDSIDSVKEDQEAARGENNREG